jgi:hypothetical protein
LQERAINEELQRNKILRLKVAIPKIRAGKLSCTALGYGLDDREFESQKGWNFSLHHRVQIGSGSHPASCPMGTRRSVPGGKVAGELS